MAELANLHLEQVEAERMLVDLNAILAHVAEMGEVDTRGVEPMAAGIPSLGEQTGDSRELLRGDTRKPSLDRAPVMAEAAESDGVFFKVPKVIER